MASYEVKLGGGGGRGQGRTDLRGRVQDWTGQGPGKLIFGLPVFLRRGLAAAIILLVLWFGASWAGERWILHPKRWGDGPTPAARGWVYRDVTFRAPGGPLLRGWWIPGTNGRTIVMVHGWTSSRREPFDKSAYLHQAGYNILVFDFRGHGTSSGTYTTIGWREPADLRAAVGEAKQLSSGPIALLGYSMGAATAVEEAATDPRVSAVIEDSGFANLNDVMRFDFTHTTHLPSVPFASLLLTIASLDLHFDPNRVRPVLAAAELHRPLLVIIGTADTQVPPKQGFELYAAAEGPKQLLVVPGAGHVAAFRTDRTLYQSTVLSFLAKNLG